MTYIFRVIAEIEQVLVGATCCIHDLGGVLGVQKEVSFSFRGRPVSGSIPAAIICSLTSASISRGSTSLVAAVLPYSFIWSAGTAAAAAALLDPAAASRR